jgi:hypothetical protein
MEVARQFSLLKSLVEIIRDIQEKYRDAEIAVQETKELSDQTTVIDGEIHGSLATKYTQLHSDLTDLITLQASLTSLVADAKTEEILASNITELQVEKHIYAGFFAGAGNADIFLNLNNLTNPG